MATLQDLVADNPNIRQQFDKWRSLRSQNGEDSTDYKAFRRHLLGIGAAVWVLSGHPSQHTSEIDKIPNETNHEHPGGETPHRPTVTSSQHTPDNTLLTRE